MLLQLIYHAAAIRHQRHISRWMSVFSSGFDSGSIVTNPDPIGTLTFCPSGSEIGTVPVPVIVSDPDL